MKKFATWLANSISFVLSLFPFKFNYYLGWGLATLWVDVLGVRKKVVYDNLDLAFSNKNTNTNNLTQELKESQKKAIFKSSVIALARSFFDTIRVPYLTSDWMNENVVFHGADNIQLNQGHLLLTLHLGSGDIAAACISEKVIPLSLITKRFKSVFMDTFWFALRTQSKTNFIDAHSSQNAFEILKALKQKRGVVFVIDQYMGKPFGVKTKFFGHETGTAYGLALFAQKTKAPVVPIYTYWGKDDKLHIHFDPVVEVESLLVDDKDQNLVNLTQKFNDVIESIVRKYPEHWMWVHRRWKKF